MSLVIIDNLQNDLYNVINYTYEESNPEKCWYSLNGKDNSTKKNMGENFVDVKYKTGKNTVTVYCEDSLGNKASSKVSFNVEKSRAGLGIVLGILVLIILGLLTSYLVYLKQKKLNKKVRKMSFLEWLKNKLNYF